MSRKVELGCESWTSFASGCSSTADCSAADIVFVTLPSTAVETAIAQCTSRCAMARGHRLNTCIVLAAVHGLSGLFRAVSAVEPSLSRPLPPPLSPDPVPYKQPRFCGRKAKCTTIRMWCFFPNKLPSLKLFMCLDPVPIDWHRIASSP